MSSLIHASVPITTSGYMCQLSSRNLKSYYKYSHSLPAAKLTVYPHSWVPLLPLSIPPLFHLHSPSSAYLPHSQPSSRLTSNVPRLSSSPSRYMSPRWKSLPPGIVTHSSSSVFRRRCHWLWSKVDLGVLFFFGLCEGHLYQSFSCPPNNLGLQK